MPAEPLPVPPVTPVTEPDQQREARPFSVLYLIALVLFLATEVIPGLLQLYGFSATELRLGLLVTTTIVAIAGALLSSVTPARRVVGALLALGYPLVGGVPALLFAGDGFESWVWAVLGVSGIAPLLLFLSWVVARRLHPVSLLALPIGLAVYLVLLVGGFLFMLGGDPGGMVGVLAAVVLPILAMVGFALLFDHAARLSAQRHAARWPSPAP